jgi:MoxR-like ATPase
MASIGQIKEAIRLCGSAKVTPFVWGFHGLGKSSVVKQLCMEQGWGVIDMRCSQIEASDLRGLPDRVDGRTVFLPPADMPIGDLAPEQILEELVAPFAELLADQPTTAKKFDALMKLYEQDVDIERRHQENLKRLQPRFRHGILFVDELNRAADDVQQAAFQLVLDREVGQYVLPPGWFVVAAGNYAEGYQTSGFMDPAFLDRFCHINFPRGDSSLEDWVVYMTQVHGEAAADVIEFAASNIDNLDGKIDGELGFQITPSRRSWDAIVRVEKVRRARPFSEEAMLLVLQGLVGMDLGNTYSRYSCPVKPRDVMAKGVAVHAKALKGLNRGQLTGLMWAISSIAKPKVAELKVADVCLDFAAWLAVHQDDKDLVVAFCRSLVTTGQLDSQDRARAAVVSNPKMAKMVGRFVARTGSEESFIDKMNSRPELQALISTVAWGGSAKDED